MRGFQVSSSKCLLILWNEGEKIKKNWVVDCSKEKALLTRVLFLHVTNHLQRTQFCSPRLPEWVLFLWDTCILLPEHFHLHSFFQVLWTLLTISILQTQLFTSCSFFVFRLSFAFFDFPTSGNILTITFHSECTHIKFCFALALEQKCIQLAPISPD